METSTIFLISLAIFGWGINGVVDKMAVNALGPKASVIIYFTASAVVFSYFLLFGNGMQFGSLNGVLLAVLGGTLVAIGGIGFYIALQKENVSLLVPFVALYPAISVLLGVLILHEKIKLVNAAGIVLALSAGILLAL